MNIFVGNLSFDAVEADVKKLFEGFGNVASVVIVMRKEKKAPKSRGFGFVEMPDEQQALAAIAAFNGKEFMGRVLDVNPARPNPTGVALPKPIKEGAKTEVQAESELNPVRNTESIREKNKISNGVKEKRQPLVTVEAGQHNKHLALKDRRVRPSGQPGTYKGGRRTHSYMKRRGLAGMQEEAKPRRKNQDNPMRWRKRQDQPKPWQKSPGEHKPWKKAEEGARPWSKSSGESKPWKKSARESKPWRKSEGGFKPWKKAEGESKPWKKPAGDAKPWSKSSERPQKSRFNPSTSSFDKLRTNPERVKRVEGSLGMVRGNGERSRTKGRKKPGGYKR